LRVIDPPQPSPPIKPPNTPAHPPIRGLDSPFGAAYGRDYYDRIVFARPHR